MPAASPAARRNLLDRVIGAVAPRAAVKRARARLQLELAERTSSFYEAAAVGRRTEHWHKVGVDANAANGPSLAVMRAKARHMVANNPYAEGALDTLSAHIVGPYGIIAKPAEKNKRVAEAWRRWSDSTDCDADGVNDFAGLQELATRTIIESGEVVIRRRRRFVDDGFAVPLQLQVAEPDIIDTGKTIDLPRSGGRIIQGVEYDAIGRRVAYWMFRDHPGAATRTSSIIGTSVRVPASEVLHVFRSTRAGQARAVTWFAPILLKLSDFDEFDDASLMKQKIAACLAVFTRDVDGATVPLGKGPSEKTDDPLVDMLEPGMVTRLNPGEDIQVVNPPSTTEYGDFAKSQLRAIAAGIGVTYEDLTGDYAGMPFSAARMSRQKHWQKIERWRWRMVVPRICAPVWQWFLEAALLAGEIGVEDMRPAEWVTAPAAMLDPDKEVAAYRRRIRAGLISPQEALRELGLDPEEVLADIQAWNKLLDKLGIVLDSDPRNMSEAGQRHSDAAAKTGDSAAGEQAGKGGKKTDDDDQEPEE